MKKPAISLLINTAQGRESYLETCLEHLKRQSDPDFEVLVIDCGSFEGEKRIAPFRNDFRLIYHWRPFDLSVSRSRNIGAGLASGDYLVLIDSDILLNPDAIAAYRHYASEKHVAIIGYYGNAPERVAPSQWYPELLVNYLDKRVHIYRPDQLSLFHYVQAQPYQFGWSANFGVSLEHYRAVGGFDERYWGWGEEDNQFAFDLACKGISLHFALDVWAEHQVHPRRTPFHVHQLSGKSGLSYVTAAPTAPLQIRDPQQALPRILKDVFGGYMPQDKGLSPEMQGLLAYPHFCYVSDHKILRLTGA